MFAVVDLRSYLVHTNCGLVETAMQFILDEFQNELDGKSIVVADRANSNFVLVCTLEEIRSLGIEKCVELYVKKGNK